MNWPHVGDELPGSKISGRSELDYNIFYRSIFKLCSWGFPNYHWWWGLYQWNWVKVFPRLLSALMWLWLPNLSKWHLFWPIGSIINKYNQQWAFYHQLHSEYLSWVFYWGLQYHNWNAFSCNRQKNHHYVIRKLWQNNLVMPKNQDKQAYLELG